MKDLLKHLPFYIECDNGKQSKEIQGILLNKYNFNWAVREKEFRDNHKILLLSSYEYSKKNCWSLDYTKNYSYILYDEPFVDYNFPIYSGKAFLKYFMKKPQINKYEQYQKLRKVIENIGN
jgi:hypothetical protein